MHHLVEEEKKPHFSISSQKTAPQRYISQVNKSLKIKIKNNKIKGGNLVKLKYSSMSDDFNCG